ncbi:hypothetical protein BJY04DRAFT_216316 [Aspergillus karnatakaensis]|uniref:uncharacterized protein n=1 Tax=Aspergillus karnatakaensis TaxID=1810916 RepID=UPI003CCD335C
MKLSIISALATLTALAASTPLSPRQTTILYPYRTYRYWINSGSVKEDPQDQLLVVKDRSPSNESSTLTTFWIPPEYAGRTCKLVIDLWDRDHSTGTQTVDVFTSVAPGRRDNNIGRVYLPKPGRGEWVSRFGWSEEFECPVGGEGEGEGLIGFEFVGAGDEVEVRWDIGVTGPLIHVL